jgi:B9 domain-containing protein 1
MDPLLSPSKRRGPISSAAGGAAGAAAARPRAAAGAPAAAAPSGFSLMVTGQIESAEVRGGRARRSPPHRPLRATARRARARTRIRARRARARRARRARARARKRLSAPSPATATFPPRPARPRAPQFRDLDNLFCRYTFAYGPDWRVLQGIDIGLSQEAQKGSGGGEGSPGVVWNFPVDVTFKTTNPHGWPRLVLSVFNSDMFGRHVVRGYGSLLVPTVPGTYTRYVRTFAPASSTYLQAFLGWATGNLPTFYDSKFVARNEGREVVRVRSTGVVRVQLCVVREAGLEGGAGLRRPPGRQSPGKPRRKQLG